MTIFESPTQIRLIFSKHHSATFDKNYGISFSGNLAERIFSPALFEPESSFNSPALHPSLLLNFKISYKFRYDSELFESESA
jgi:hypothetical protein